MTDSSTQITGTKWNGLRRTPFTRKPIAREVKWERSTLNRESPKRKAENRERRRVLAEMRKEDPLCARCRVVPWTDGHELLRRSAGGSITDRNNIVGLCRPCHEHIGAHPAEAIRDGWQISRFA